MITLTENALSQIKKLISLKKDSLGLRIGINTRGCAGLSYTMDYATQDNIQDCEKNDKFEINLYIENKAIIYIIGTEMDFIKEEYGERFVFNNPNQTSECGCGESFHV